MIPRAQDLATFLKLLARSATGQLLSAYTSFLSGARRPGEIDGPDEFYVVLLDNGRTRLLPDREKRQTSNTYESVARTSPSRIAAGLLNGFHGAEMLSQELRGALADHTDRSPYMTCSSGSFFEFSIVEDILRRLVAHAFQAQQWLSSEQYVVVSHHKKNHFQSFYIRQKVILTCKLMNYPLVHFLCDVFAFLPAFFVGAGFNSAARAAANRAIGTRNGEQLT